MATTTKKAGKKAGKKAAEETAVAIRPEYAVDGADYGAHAGAGFEDQDASDISIPFLQILQALSPQLQKGNEKFIEGAEIGDIIDNVSNEVISGEILFVPALRFKQYVQWKKKDAGGGLVARYDKGDPFVQECIQATGQSFGKLDVPGEKDHELIETVYVVGNMYRGSLEADPEPCILSFTSSKIKVFKKWNTAMNKAMVVVNGTKQKVPLFANVAALGTVSETNSKNQTYSNYAIKPANGDIKSSLLAPDSQAFVDALALRDVFSAGEVVMADESAEAGGSSDATAGDDVF